MLQPRVAHLLIVPMFLLVLVLVAPSSVWADGNANFFLGQKTLDESDWEPVEDQGEFGAEISFGGEDWPIHIAIDAFTSAEERDDLGVQVKGTTFELGVGVRKVWSPGKTRPYFGGGLALVNGEIEGSLGGITVSDDDTVLGAWVGGGVFWRLGSAFNIGFAARYSKATITLFGLEGEGGGAHAGLLLGWGWPATR